MVAAAGVAAARRVTAARPARVVSDRPARRLPCRAAGRQPRAASSWRRQRWPSRVSSTAIPRASQLVAEPIGRRPVPARPGRGPLVEQAPSLVVELVGGIRQDAEDLVEGAQRGEGALGVGRGQRPARRSGD